MFNSVVSKDSWMIHSENIAVKKIDKSVFLYSQTGIPKVCRSFFGIEHNAYMQNINIELVFKGNTFNGTLRLDKSPTRIKSKLKWDKELTVLLLDVFNEEVKKLIEINDYKSNQGIVFEKVGVNTYRIGIIQ